MTADLGVIREWLFKGLSVEDTLDTLEAEGIAVRAASDPGAVQRALPLEDFSAPIRRAAMDAFPAYLAFFCLENAVRELVAERLGDERGADWWETSASRDIKTKVEGRKIKEGRDRWHIRRGAQEINYTDFGDLITLIRNNWDVFQDLFPDQNWIIGRLTELEASRNIIAHSNTLDDREMSRLLMYLQDWIRQVG